MRQIVRIAVLSTSVLVTTLMSGCIVVPAHRCGYYHCW
jgi:hypothetical protein